MHRLTVKTCNAVYYFIQFAYGDNISLSLTIQQINGVQFFHISCVQQFSYSLIYSIKDNRRRGIADYRLTRRIIRRCHLELNGNCEIDSEKLK